MTPNG